MGRRFSNLPKCNPFQSSPVLSIHVPSWLFRVLLEFFYSLKPLFWAYGKPGNPESGNGPGFGNGTATTVNWETLKPVSR